jgi:metal-responsive CopG/Arc/MetJ family transcriptional regulator
MRTIQMTLDDDLVIAVDRVSKELKTSRSAFARKALRDALARYSLEQLERKHRRGTSSTRLPLMSFRLGKPSTGLG